jgi:hypothetical protein
LKNLKFSKWKEIDDIFRENFKKIENNLFFHDWSKLKKFGRNFLVEPSTNASNKRRADTWNTK